MNKGYHSIMVLDDLTEHAVAYRQISLLLRRPPSREAYPGDIFYLHSKLLERNAQLRKTLGGGSLTCIPVIETKMGDISAYIPTNVISITDGQIFLSKQMLNKSIKPAIYIELSVSRVGSKAQYGCMKEVSNGIKRDYRLFKDYETMSKVTTDLDRRVLAFVERGLLIRKFLNQKLYQSYTLLREVFSLYAVRLGYFDNFDEEYIDLVLTLLFNGNFSNLYLNGNLSLYMFVHPERQLYLESLLIISPIDVFKDEFFTLLDLFVDFFYAEIVNKLRSDVTKSYFKLLCKLATKVRKVAM
jgi:proton translocating ATP synthase F1 alpha subunit